MLTVTPDARPDGAAVRARREQLGLSRPALGYAAGGVSVGTIRHVEIGLHVPHLTTQTALAAVLGADLFPLVAARHAAEATA